MNIGASCALVENGEMWVLDHLRETLANSRAPVIFDVGANVGDYTTQCLARLPGAQLYCFEPSPAAFAQLDSKFSSRENVNLCAFGLGEREESVTLYSDTSGSALASVYLRRLDHLGINLNHTEKIELTTLNQFCAERKIEHIDLLKLDVEGHEFQALQGAQELLRTQAIDFIQFEFGGTDIDSRTFLQDFFYLLDPQYQICRVLQDGVRPIKNYHERLEIFAYTNYLAVSRKLNETLKAIERR